MAEQDGGQPNGQTKEASSAADQSSGKPIQQQMLEDLDLEGLANAVFKLLLQELQIERDRTGKI
jgi:hypothetical protein